MIDFNALVAPKGFAPETYQSPAPREVWGFKQAVATSRDLTRVLSLPRRLLELDGTERAETLIDMMTERFARPIQKNCKCAQIDPERHHDEGCITRLRLIQALALREIGICGGLLGPIGVGHGKTLIDVLAPLAFQSVGVNLSVLLVPPKLIPQLIGDYEYIGQHFHMPQIIVHGHAFENTLQRMLNTVHLERGAPTVHVMSYARISLKEATDWLEQRLKPQAIIADEVHKLRNIIGTATGSRVARYMDDHAETRFAGWSGSITDKTIRDYAHLARWALRGGSPLPLDPEVVQDWARAIDPSDNPADPGPLMKLCAPGERFVDGYRRRVIETLGVVSTSAPAVDCALEISERPAPPIPHSVKEALKMVRGEHPDSTGPMRPDGEELTDALAISRTAIQVACGFYYKWIFPKCVFPRDIPLVEAWREARKNYLREVREKLKSREEHLDSELLCRYAAQRAWGDRPSARGLPVWKSKYWPTWRDTKNTVAYDTETVWLDDYLARDAAQWATEHRGIVWYEHGAFGDMVSRLSGLPMFGAGKDAKALLLGDARRGIKGEDGSRSVICSIKAHGTGTNGLQHRFADALVANPMSSPTGWEQTLGRLHRIGQKADVVRNWFYRHTDEMKKHVNNALNAAMYVEGTLGAQQKIVMAMSLE